MSQNTLRFLLISLLCLGSLGSLGAQSRNPDQDDDKSEQAENTSDSLNKKNRWQARLPGGSYIIPLNHIVSISKHRYLLDGSVIVTEVTIDSKGNSLARFYYLEPVTKDSSLNTAQKLTKRGQDLLGQAGRATGDDLHLMAQKNYPQTTHAHTVEYRLLSLTELDALYNSLYSAWDSGKGRDFTIR